MSRENFNEIHEATGVVGCSILIRKNHQHRWCVYPNFKINEICDGLEGRECIELAASLHRASERVRELNATEGMKYLFETKGVVE